MTCNPRPTSCVIRHVSSDMCQVSRTIWETGEDDSEEEEEEGHDDV